MNQTPTELLAPFKASVAAAVQELLRVSSTAATIFRVPGTEPEQIILAGEIEALNKLLESQETVPPVSWHKLGAGPRSWTIVLSGDSGVVGELGCKFEKVPERLERVDVVEAAPLLRELGELQWENEELHAQLEQQDQSTAPAPTAEQISTWRTIRGHVVTDTINGTDITLPARYSSDVLALFDIALPRVPDEDENAAPSQPSEAQSCTCPSGDGSLRWPCPQHPPEKAQPGMQDARAVTPEGLQPNWAGEFISYQQWISKGQSWLKSPSHRPPICVDSKGRRCSLGSDMARARDEGAFPVRYFWDCESPPPASEKSGGEG